MFSIKYLEKSSENPNGKIFAQITNEANWIYDNDEMPFLFEVFLNKKLIWSVDLNPNSWASWDCLDNDNLEAYIKGKDGTVISHFKLDIWVNQNSTEQFFEVWMNKNPNSYGIAIGTHDGTSGEWVNQVKNKKTNAVLVEASEKQFNLLKTNYSGFENTKLRNCLVTSDGRDVEFFEFGPGHANTVDPEHFKKHYFNDDYLKISKVKSISINDLIIEENLETKLDWLHLDTEAIDDEIIMGLDFNRVVKPKLIIFETINFSEERTGDKKRINTLFDWLSKNGYHTKYDYWNSFAFLK